MLIHTVQYDSWLLRWAPNFHQNRQEMLNNFLMSMLDDNLDRRRRWILTGRPSGWPGVMGVEPGPKGRFSYEQTLTIVANLSRKTARANNFICIAISLPFNPSSSYYEHYRTRTKHEISPFKNLLHVQHLGMVTNIWGCKSFLGHYRKQHTFASSDLFKWATNWSFIKKCTKWYRFS